jgi:hypothetical protein
VRLGAFLADVLADLEIAELVNQPGAKRNAKEECRKAGESGAGSGVPEDTERADVLEELFVE